MSTTSSTTSSLEANRVLRILLAIIGTALCYVPFRLLLRNRQYAAVVLILATGTMNFFTVLNASIWPNDNYAVWWSGHGLCDIEVYLSAPLQTAYAASIFAIMRRLASQVKLNSVVGQESREQSRKRLVKEAGGILAIPAFQLLFTYFDLAQRYIVGALVGCSAVYGRSWPKAVVFDTPPAAFAVASLFFACKSPLPSSLTIYRRLTFPLDVIFKRYRKIDREASAILTTTATNHDACQRISRTRRRLYRMCLGILVLYVPLMLFFSIRSLQDTFSAQGLRPYSFHRMRYEPSPYPWHAILFVPSWLVPAATLEQPWIPILTSFVVVAFFGITDDARKMWLRIAEDLGVMNLGAYLAREYDGIVVFARELVDRARQSMKPGSPYHEKSFNDEQ